MKVSVGIVCSVLGATIAFYLAIVSLVTLPADGTARWFAIGGIAGLSLIAGILINGISMQDYFKVSRAYNTLTSRLSPLLYGGLEDVIQRRKSTFDSSGDLNFVVLSPINNFYRVVGATYPAEHPLRQNNTRIGQGLRGFFFERKVAGYARADLEILRSNEGNRQVFDRNGQVLAEVPMRQLPGILADSVDAKWRYYRPIFERSAANPWSDRVVGMLSVHLLTDDADSFIRTKKFQHQVDSIAAEVSPYLDAIQILVGEEKAS